METIRKFISKESLATLYTVLSENHRIYAPVKSNDNKTVFQYDRPYSEVSFDYIQSALSVKNVVFPRVETLFEFTSTKSNSVIKEVELDKIPAVVLFGAHPCDTAAMDVLASIFCWDTKDLFFKERMEKLLVIGLACRKSDEYCFCTSVGLAPDSSRGSDLLLIPLKSGNFIVDVVTEKGKAVYEANAKLFTQLENEEIDLTSVTQKFDHKQVSEKLKTAFNHSFWIENSLRCLGCGACAFICPTCACFDIQDESYGKKGQRYRSWDSCGTSLFTLHTSGHNPREVQSQRWRQRILHKFSYMPERNNSFGCVGCGRCSRGCPVDMNISEQLQELQNL